MIGVGLLVRHGVGAANSRKGRRHTKLGEQIDGEDFGLVGADTHLDAGLAEFLDHGLDAGIHGAGFADIGGVVGQKLVMGLVERFGRQRDAILREARSMVTRAP